MRRRAISAIGGHVLMRRSLSSSASSPGGTCDTLIVGGGVMGSSLAFHLAALRGTGEGIVVIERDSTYRAASAAPSASGIRQQFSLLENVQMSLYGIKFLKSAAAPERLAVDGDSEQLDMQFQERGYLFLASSTGHGTLLSNHKVQRAAGADWMALGPHAN